MKSALIALFLAFPVAAVALPNGPVVAGGLVVGQAPDAEVPKAPGPLGTMTGEHVSVGWLVGSRVTHLVSLEFDSAAAQLDCSCQASLMDIMLGYELGWRFAGRSARWAPYVGAGGAAGVRAAQLTEVTGFLGADGPSSEGPPALSESAPPGGSSGSVALGPSADAFRWEAHLAAGLAWRAAPPFAWRFELRVEAASQGEAAAELLVGFSYERSGDLPAGR